MKKNTKRTLTLLLALVLCLGLLPAAAMAEEAEVEYDITFDADGGQFSDGAATKVMRTHSVESQLSEEPLHFVAPPDEEPTRAGHRFVRWYLASPTENPGIAGISFTKNETVKAYWEPLPEVVLTLDPNGGTCSVKSVKLDASGAAPTLREELPVPTREGYDFAGWYYETPNIAKHQVKVGETFGADATLTAEWTEKHVPQIREVWFHLEGGTVVSVGGIKPDSYGAVKLPHGDFVQRPDGGEEILGEMLTDENGKLPALPVLQKVGYIFDGWYTMKNGGNKVTTDTVFTGSGNYGRDYLWARWKAEKTTVTVKFNLNYKNPKDETPGSITVSKGYPISLPDGKKLTCPFLTHEFYAWCMKGEDGLLYPWNESTPVTEDMTLYAGWIRKGRVIRNGEAITVSPSQPLPDEKADEKPAETPAAPAFTDVASSSPFAPAISWAVEKKITNGKTDTTFGPGDPCTRAQIVTFLWRAAGSPEPKTMEAEYADVTNADAYFYKAVQWAAEMGMEESGTFKPGDPCTRGQAMYFIWKARAGASSAGSAPSFTDLSKDSLYYDAVLWAVGQGVTNGTGDGTTFSPDNPCTRGQIVTFLYRAYEK